MTSEAIDVVIQRPTLEKGYLELVMYNFKGLKTPIDESVLERLGEKLIYVEKLTVGNMYTLPSEVRT